MTKQKITTSEKTHLNQDLPDWIFWNKSEGKYVLFFEECKDGAVPQ